ncbi:MAG TPA: hypothetical protein VGM60_03190 [Pseudonocardia sp.]
MGAEFGFVVRASALLAGVTFGGGPRGVGLGDAYRRVTFDLLDFVAAASGSTTVLTTAVAR